jgi:hypothetical protein
MGALHSGSLTTDRRIGWPATDAAGQSRPCTAAACGLYGAITHPATNRRCCWQLRAGIMSNPVQHAMAGRDGRLAVPAAQGGHRGDGRAWTAVFTNPPPTDAAEDWIDPGAMDGKGFYRVKAERK